MSFVRATCVYCDLIVLTCNLLQIGVRSAIGIVQRDLPLTEITKEDFLCAWTHFELVAAAKEGNAAKRATVLPTLLHGILVDIFIKLSEKGRADLKELRKALMSKVGLTKDLLVAEKELITQYSRREKQ